jgi:hypothetical protein
VPDSYSTALGASRLLLRVFRILNLVTAAALLACLVASFIFEPAFREFFGKRPARIDPAWLLPILRVWMLLAAPVFAAVHIQLSRLLDMIETVRAGDPFAPENAVRMKTIAWCLLGIQVFHLVCGVMAAAMNAAGSRIDWSFSATGWIAVALLFVLAQVFAEGARIRSDLEAMI